MCVCKSWYRIVSSSSFIKSNISCNTNKLLYTFFTHNDSYSLVGRMGSGDNKKYYYTPEQFGINVRKHDYGLKVFGTCNGLLCVSHVNLGVDSIVYLLNPVIRRAKNIGKIPIEVQERKGNLCLGYYDGDYKVIIIVRGCGNYRVGVYSLSTNGWKILSCDSNNFSSNSFCGYVSSKCVNGVAYFVKNRDGIVCFDLNDEMIREIRFPEKFSPAWWPWTCDSFTLEECGESVALMEIRGDGHLVKWGLRSCGGAESLWEKECTIALEADPRQIHLIGLKYNGEYILRLARAGLFPPTNFRGCYLCDLRKSELKKCSLPQDVQAIDYLVGNLVLLNEQTLYPLVDSEATCTETTLVLCKRRPPEKKKKISRKGQNGMQGRTKRKLEG